MKPIIKLEDVWKIYELGEVKVEALRGLNLEVHRGEFLTVFGKSGSGKSTALNMIGALDIPTKGRIYLDGKNISRLEESDLAQLRGKKIGFVFQIFNLIPSLTALENVMLPMVFQEMNRAERIKRAEKLLRDVQLEHRIHHKPNELSGGERQRVSIARALANNPDVVLADEPTGNLDSKTGDEIMDLFKNLHKKFKKTIIMVTHDMSLIKFSQRTYILKDGKDIKTLKGKITREMIA
ncbi:MAG: ABC transporter ATP-binding protein [Candidatus Nanoarchaeia archaeon]|jgi:putative ABC transport system ATP-binding protein|nr:ABC transporter ATP-binding protein [Candidatus Nanoarchaeia archaeon]|tara:strand:- start:2234 stop:2944 length:711 start_codon:yes stop_codon:yes gene_type:complete